MQFPIATNSYQKTVIPVQPASKATTNTFPTQAPCTETIQNAFHAPPRCLGVRDVPFSIFAFNVIK